MLREDAALQQGYYNVQDTLKPELVRDVTNGLSHQHYENRLVPYKKFMLQKKIQNWKYN